MKNLGWIVAVVLAVALVAILSRSPGPAPVPSRAETLDEFYARWKADTAPVEAGDPQAAIDAAQAKADAEYGARRQLSHDREMELQARRQADAAEDQAQAIREAGVEHH